jgi:hypothetical protein
MVDKGRGKRGAKVGRGAKGYTNNARSSTQNIENINVAATNLTNDDDNMLHLLTQAVDTSRYQGDHEELPDPSQYLNAVIDDDVEDIVVSKYPHTLNVTSKSTTTPNKPLPNPLSDRTNRSPINIR